MHYSLAVIISPSESLEKVLSQYDEHLEVEPYIYRTRQDIIEAGKRQQEGLKELMKRNPDFIPDKDEKKLLKIKTDDEYYAYARNEYAEYDEEGNEYATYNPKAKWDYWVLGGRWSDKLILKNGNTADMAPLKDVSFEDNDAIYYQTLNWWKEYVEGEDNPDALSYSEKYTAEELARIRCKFYTCDVLVDGQWHSSDGFSSENEWINEYYDRFIRGRNPNDIIYIVDCHI